MRRPADGLRLAARCGALLLLLAAGATGADGARLNLRLQEVSLEEAASQLSRAAGVPVEVRIPRFSASVKPPPYIQVLQEKASFDWSSATFGQALRQLTRRYGLRSNRIGVGYTLSSGFALPPPPEKRVGLYQQKGVSVHVRRVVINDRRSLTFDGSPTGADEQSLLVELAVEVEDDAGRVAGFSNVSARDDLGGILLLDRTLSISGGIAGAQYPDEWTGSVVLTGGSPRASRLEWLEGDLVGYRGYTPGRLEIPLAASAEPVRRAEGPISVELARFDPGGPTAGPSLTARVRIEPGALVTTATGERTLLPLLVTESGQMLPPTNSLVRQIASAQQGQYETELRFAAGMDRPARLLYQFVVKSQPERLFTFRLTDVPLRGQDSARAPLPPISPGATQRAFYQKGGGLLVTQVRAGDQPAGEGILSIGLVPVGGQEPEPVSWIQLPVGQDGVARLQDLKPGRYRVLRAFRSRQELPGGDVGRWLESELTLEVPARKETVLPPLVWQPERGSGAPARPQARPAPPAASKPKTTVKPRTRRPAPSRAKPRRPR